jgi:hypothetical protein
VTTMNKFIGIAIVVAVSFHFKEISAGSWKTFNDPELRFSIESPVPLYREKDAESSNDYVSARSLVGGADFRVLVAKLPLMSLLSGAENLSDVVELTFLKTTKPEKHTLTKTTIPCAGREAILLEFNYLSDGRRMMAQIAVVKKWRRAWVLYYEYPATKAGKTKAVIEKMMKTLKVD